ncbi:MAG: transglutaminase domain-containing protein, partial [Verrucomicrobiaceae bacterium]
LMGYEAPAHFKSNLSKLDEMMTIWKAVVEGVRYLPDSSDGNPDNDAWQIAQETQMLGTGDCEDSSIYLADWLLARGFEVRVCMGRYSEMGGHAWVVVRLDGKSYLLESTNPHANTKVQPLSADVGSRYVPEISFDRQAFYVRSNTGMTWDGDYWTETKWQRVAPQPLAGKLSFGALPTKTGK